MTTSLRWLLFCVVMLLSSCSKAAPPSTAITLATTTSARDSGLLQVLLPEFEKRSGIHVRVVAVGSGQAMELARRGDADLLLVHSPEAEQKFIDDGWGEKRIPLMHNDFLIAGPADDPAGLRETTGVLDALRAIFEKRSLFVSRGDESGTHVREKALWKSLELEPQGDWYIRSGTGMALAMRMAHEKKAYILCDRSTYLSLRSELDLSIVSEGDERLLNRYSLLMLNPVKLPGIRRETAQRFADFLVSPESQTIIGRFGIETFGQPLFTPDAVPQSVP